MNILGVLKRRNRKTVERSLDVMRKLSHEDYDRYLQLSLDWEVFDQPEEVLRLYKYNPYFIYEYGVERIENAEIVLKTLKDYGNDYQKVKDSYKKRHRTKFFNNNFYNADKIKYQNLLLGVGEKEWMPEFIKGFKLVTASYDSSRYECLILNKVVETLDRTLLLQVQDTGCGADVINFGTGMLPLVIFPISSVLPKGSTNYHRVKAILNKMTEDYMGIADNDDYEYHTSMFFSYTRYYEKTGKVAIVLSKAFWDAYADLRKYISINSEILRSLKSGNTMRLYELLLLNHKFTIPVVKLREMLKLTDRYSNNSDFIRKVIEPAKNELAVGKAPFSFRYEIIRGRSNNTIEAIAFSIDRKSFYQPISGWAIGVAERFKTLLS